MQETSSFLIVVADRPEPKSACELRTAWSLHYDVIMLLKFQALSGAYFCNPELTQKTGLEELAENYWHYGSRESRVLQITAARHQGL
jgi:hypothetical protein